MFPPNHIKTILFDLDGTLRHSIPAGGDVFVEYTKTLGLSISEEESIRAARWEHYYWANSLELKIDFETYKSEDRDFWKNYARRHLVALGASNTQAEELAPMLNQYMFDHYKFESVVYPEIPDVLAKLKDEKYRLGVVSNRDRPFGDELIKLGLSEFFEFSLAGGEVKSFKPEPGIFLAALERVDSTPQESIYVGDNYFADVIGSRRAGLMPVLYDPRGLFPEAGCPTITSFDQLIAVIQNL